MKIYAIAIYKGGGGKTTTAVNLAAALAELGKRVLVVDLDPQGHASLHVGLLRAEHEHTEAGRVVAGLSRVDATITHPAFGFELVPGGKGTAAAASMLESHRQFLGALGAALRAAQGWDVVLIDTPPSHGTLTQAALRAADGVLVPLELEYLAWRGFESLMSTIEYEREHNPDLALTGWFQTNSDLRLNLSRGVLERARQRWPDHELRTQIRIDTLLGSAPGWAQPITAYRPKSHGAADYRALAAELIERGLV